MGLYILADTPPANEAWDCDPFVTLPVETYDIDLDIEDDTGDWQVLALDRFGDRTVNANW